MKKWIALMIFCICSMTIGAQNVKTIRGHVSDEKGHDVKAASIIADDGHTATVSNENGYFILNVPEKTHTITVSQNKRPAHSGSNANGATTIENIGP